MHEGSIAQAILDSAVAELPADAARIERITVAVGALSGVERHCLAAFFQELARGTKAEGAELVVRTVPAAVACEACGLTGELTGAEPVEIACRRCGGPNRVAGGSEMFLESLEVQV